MTTPWVSTHSDLMLSGLSPAACAPDAREIQGVDLVTGTWELDAHGFDGGELVRFVALVGNTIPTLINPLTYYAVAPTIGNPDFFTLAPLLIPSDAGTGIVSIVENVIPKIDRIMAEFTSLLVGSAKAYRGPWLQGSQPAWTPMMVAKLAAPTICNYLRVPSSRYDIKLVADGFAWAEARRTRLENGEQLDDGVATFNGLASPGGNDGARATNGLLTGRICDMSWVTGTL